MNKEAGRFGQFGGQYVPETLMNALKELEQGMNDAMSDQDFLSLYQKELHTYSGRPTPLYFAKHCTESLNGAEIYLKREDLNHTGSHKINNAIGQALLAKRLGKKTSDCRNRSRSTRGSNSNDCCKVWDGMYRVYG